MEVSGVVFRPLPCFSGGAGINDASQYSHHSCSLNLMRRPPSSKFSIGDLLRMLGRRDSSVNPNPNPNPNRKLKLKFCYGVVGSDHVASGFSDNGHVQYYKEKEPTTTTKTRCGGGTAGGKKKEIINDQKDKEKEKEKEKEKKMKKRKLKLVKGLSKNLSTFSEMGGFGLDPNHHGQMISVEAAELLLGQLQQLRAEEMELKRKRKEEKAKLKAMRMQSKMDCEVLSCTSSSSSSESSSDSECGEVVNMSRLKSETFTRPITPNADQETTLPLPSAPSTDLIGKTIELQPVVVTHEEAISALPSTQIQVGNTREKRGIDVACSTGNCTNISNVGDIVGRNDVNSLPSKKIEVCMGGKCKKSGAASLLEEFQKVVGGEGSVVGCKCMGKCRDGPNVRVFHNAETDRVDDSSTVRTQTNPLCIGVGLEDVGLIVANFFGGNQESDLGLAQPAAAAAF